MQTKQLNLRIDSDDLKELSDMAKTCELPHTTLAGIFLRAAIRAVRDEAGRVRLPLDFKVIEREAIRTAGRAALNEKK